MKRDTLRETLSASSWLLHFYQSDNFKQKSLTGAQRSSFSVPHSWRKHLFLGHSGSLVPSGHTSVRETTSLLLFWWIRARFARQRRSNLLLKPWTWQLFAHADTQLNTRLPSSVTDQRAEPTSRLGFGVRSCWAAAARRDCRLRWRLRRRAAPSLPPPCLWLALPHPLSLSNLLPCCPPCFHSSPFLTCSLPSPLKPKADKGNEGCYHYFQHFLQMFNAARLNYDEVKLIFKHLAGCGSGSEATAVLFMIWERES